MKRLFIAIKSPLAIQEAIRDIVGEWQLHTNQHVRWIDPAIAHLTLFFLGDTLESKVPDIIKAIQKAASAARPFKLVLSRLGAFPSASTARVAFIQLEEINSRTLNLTQKRLSSSLSELGFAAENKKFIPHITLGRLTRPASLNTSWYVTRPLSWSVDQIDLMESQLGPTGPAYSTIASIHLA